MMTSRFFSFLLEFNVVWYSRTSAALFLHLSSRGNDELFIYYLLDSQDDFIIFRKMSMTRKYEKCERQSRHPFEMRDGK